MAIFLYIKFFIIAINYIRICKTSINIKNSICIPPIVFRKEPKPLLLQVQIADSFLSCQSRHAKLVYVIDPNATYFKPGVLCHCCKSAKTSIADTCIGDTSNCNNVTQSSGSLKFDLGRYDYCDAQLKDYNNNNVRCSVKFHTSEFHNCSNERPFQALNDSFRTKPELPNETFSRTTKDYFTTKPDVSRVVQTTQTDTAKSSEYLLYLLIAPLVVLALIVVCFAYKYRRNIKNRFMQMPNFSQAVFLVFCDEDPKHKESVLKFASSLRLNFGFKVLLHLYDSEEVYRDPSTWLDNSLSSCAVVLIIWSPEAEKRWHERDTSYDRLDLFTPVLKQVREDLNFKWKLRKYVFAYFNNCRIPRLIKANNVPCYDLAKEQSTLGKMLVKMAEEKNNNLRRSLRKEKQEKHAGECNGQVAVNLDERQPIAIAQ